MGCGTVATVVRADSADAGAPEDEFLFSVKCTEQIRTEPPQYLLELRVDASGLGEERHARLNAQTSFSALVARIGKRRFSAFGVERAENGLLFRVLA